MNNIRAYKKEDIENKVRNEFVTNQEFPGLVKFEWTDEKIPFPTHPYTWNLDYVIGSDEWVTDSSLGLKDSNGVELFVNDFVLLKFDDFSILVYAKSIQDFYAYNISDAKELYLAGNLHFEKYILPQCEDYEEEEQE